MNQLSAEIFANYQMRKTKAQKSKFIELMQEHFPALIVQEGGFPKNRNLIVGDVATAKYVLTAHYDTCARLPFPNLLTPKNILLYILYQFALVIPFLLISFVIGCVFTRLIPSSALASALSFIATMGIIIWIFFLGKPNEHTANDNSSGVITLIELMDSLSEQQKRETAFVFFDNEENGLLGSAYFRKQYKKQMKEKLLINFDCVSDGEHIVVVQNKQARRLHGAALDAAFVSRDGKIAYKEPSSKLFYPSDQVGFPRAVAVAAFNKKRFVGLYLARIHTAKDTVFDETNIKYICESMRSFYDMTEK